MALTLYVETNFPIRIAKGQDLEAAEFLESRTSDVQLVIPSVCFMEAFLAWEDEEKQKNKLMDSLSSQIREVGRNAWPRAKLLANHLLLSKTESENLFNDTEVLLNEVLYRLTEDAEIIDVGYHIIQDSLLNQYIPDPTDNLILSAILHHARRHYTTGQTAFFSSNHKDFGKPEVVKALKGAKVKYFPRVDAALGWLRSRPASEAGE